MACDNPKTRNLATIKSDMLLAGITQLITVILDDNLLFCEDYDIELHLKFSNKIFLVISIIDSYSKIYFIPKMPSPLL